MKLKRRITLDLICRRENCSGETSPCIIIYWLNIFSFKQVIFEETLPEVISTKANWKKALT